MSQLPVSTSAGDDSQVLEMDSGDDCTILRVYLKPLNCTFKNIKMVHFMHIHFTTIKKYLKNQNQIWSFYLQFIGKMGDGVTYEMTPLGCNKNNSQLKKFNKQQAT